ncbi:MAG: phospholipase [Candidatus Aenigmatarchaeota archaeon]|nr:MAG: phospholipase [Candidatus Aenigmarchaeota archaeon]
MPSFAKLTVLILIFLSGLVLGFFLSPAGTPAEIGENQAIPLNDRDYFPTLKNLIDSANSSVKIIMYTVNFYPPYPDSPSNSLINALGNASERGIGVKIITDETPTEKPVLSMLRERGVDIKFDSKDVTTHAKLIIIDSKIVIIGSTNWSYYSIDKNHEANVMIISEPLAGQFEHYFESVWVES